MAEPLAYAEYGNDARKAVRRSLARIGADLLLRADLPMEQKMVVLRAVRRLGNKNFAVPVMDNEILAVTRHRRSVTKEWWAWAQEALFAGGRAIPTTHLLGHKQVVPEVRPARPQPYVLESFYEMIAAIFTGYRDPAPPEGMSKETWGAFMQTAPPPLYKIERRPWLPRAVEPEQMEASDYSKECCKLQATSAGRKAKKLLLDHLSAAQADDYLRKGYFKVTVPQTPLHDSDPKVRHYLIQRGYPNGNIMEVAPFWATNNKLYEFPIANYCFHPVEPYPLDDILLAQKMIIETDEKEFLKQANRTTPYGKRPAPADDWIRAV